ncbi:Acyl-CoA dehydrogenase [Desulfatibacillum alkenivorans DSM 16219]|jgi:alkylation response protein AidB-like acyl-CoA dehydrogenase|uniref:Acyl-[acyl-carrier-protein] dehydrogenase MbtN n=1 Tax=Desulfatibacillum alkenivorans DSM 16219 TaxID=1121393 RepID=A0A1M6F5M9_9BACT|nr:acyl-CoA dehydrogenase family protein [Desulfatibacillum alkenivorans]SHI93034.1 Acyl-CoA dehydrogenase [Desulfatibacillum alkenivorans DSM 16219]
MGVLKYTEDHERFRLQVREYMEKEVLPHTMEWEEAHIVPKEAWRKMGEAGYLCPCVSKEYGGPGLDFLYSVIITEEMAAVGQAGLAAMLHSDIVVPYINTYGTEEQKKKYLPGCVSGAIITAVAMTEPGAGSDVGGLEATAEEDGDEIVINGVKTFISNGINCDLVVLAARNPEIADKHAGVSLYLVEDGTPGFTRGKHLDKMGMHSQDTAELFFSNCRIPKENILGQKGHGFLMLMEKLQQERLMSAIANVAGAETALKWAVAYAKEAIVDGKPLSKSQAVKFKLAEMATDINLNRAFLDNLINDHMAGKDVTAQTMMSKYASSEMMNLQISDIMDLFGEYGLLESSPVARGFRDQRITTIFAGTTEIMKTIIAKSLGL